jgi:hypothetical protein
MSTCRAKLASLGVDLIPWKGEATPAQALAPTSPPTADIPHGIKETIVLTVRLDAERCRRLFAMALASRRARPIGRSWSRRWMPIWIRWRSDMLTPRRFYVIAVGLITPDRPG